LEQINDLIKRQDELHKLANEQQVRDRAKSRRQELANAQTALAPQAAELAKKRADLLKQAGVAPADEKKMRVAATQVSQERLSAAVELQSQLAAELAKIAEATEALAKKLTGSAPDPKPHQQLAKTSKALADRATALAQQQRHLATEVGKTAEQRSAQQNSIAEAEPKLQQQIAQLSTQHGKLADEAGSWMQQVRKHAPLWSGLPDALKTSGPIAAVNQAGRHLKRNQLDQAAAAQQSAVSTFGETNKAMGETAHRARQENQRLKVQLSKWDTAEAKRLAAVKAHQAEVARRKQAEESWRAAEAKRKAALAKWQAEEQGKRKAALAKWQADQEAKRKAAATQIDKAPATAPATQATSNPATTQRVARATTQKAPPSAQPPKALVTPAQPPKALATPLEQPKFPALTRPPEKPAPKPQPKQPLWDDMQLKAADALAAQAAELAKRFQQSHAQTVALAKQTKQLGDRKASLKSQINKQDASLLKRQRGLHKTAGQVLTQATKASPGLKQLTEANSPIPAMQGAANAIKAHDLSSAPKSQITAAERLEALAKALQSASDKENAAAADAAKTVAEVNRQAAAQRDVGKQARQLQQQQAQLHKQTSQLAKRLAPLGPNLADKIVSDLQRQQEQLAKEVSELSSELAKPQQADGVELPAQPEPFAQKAAMQAREAGKALGAMAAERMSRKPEQPASSDPASKKVRKLQAMAADQLDRLVERLQEPVEEDPARWEQQATEEFLRVQQAERAIGLAERQRRLSHQLERTLAGKPMQAVAIEQTELRKEVVDFSQAAEFLTEQVEVMEPKVPTMKPKILANAQKATELLAKTAPSAMDTAAKALSQDNASQALKPMSEGRKAVAQAHKLLETLQAQFAKAASDAPHGDPSDEDRSKRLTESLIDQYEAYRRMLEVQEAAADSALDPTAAAAQAMRERLAAQAAHAAANANAARMQSTAREFLEAAWEAAGETNIDPEKAVILPGAPMGGGNWRIVIPDTTILDLEIIGLTRSDWARLPGTLREEVIQAAEERAPAEYREVIKRYFKAISQRAGSGWTRPLLDDTSSSAPVTQPAGKAAKR
jgi:hypothetical protein